MNFAAHAVRLSLISDRREVKKVTFKEKCGMKEKEKKAVLEEDDSKEKPEGACSTNYRKDAAERRSRPAA